MGKKEDLCHELLMVQLKYLYVSTLNHVARQLLNIAARTLKWCCRDDRESNRTHEAYCKHLKCQPHLQHTGTVNIIHYIYIAGHPVPAFPLVISELCRCPTPLLNHFLTSMRVTSVYSAHPSPYVSSFPIPNINA